MSYIEIQHVYKRYRMGDAVIEANRDVSFSVEKGELAMILGNSGAGKSTVLNILGGMDTNDEGRVIVDGRDIAGYNEPRRIAYRRFQNSAGAHPSAVEPDELYPQGHGPQPVPL